MSGPILHTHLSHAPWQSPQTSRLPGTTPIAVEDWLTVDEAFAAQLGERERLLRETRGAVCAALPGTEAALAELYDTVLAALDARPDYTREGGAMRRPDGACVPLDANDPLGTLGRLVQEDFCLMEKPAGADEHVLTAAILCFPANWTLAEKLGRPLTAIHTPVPDYDTGLAARVQRLFDGLRPVETGGRILMRMNALDHDRPDLFQTRPQAEARPHGHGHGGWLRIERQTLRRLPRTGAVVFAIHTTVLDRAALPPDVQVAFAAHADRR
jgi:hypothetical protein